MPQISEFHGIVIAMYYDDHPPPHFHAISSDGTAQIGIQPVQFLRGNIPFTIRRKVLRWARRHEQALLANWERAQLRVPLERIPPLR